MIVAVVILQRHRPRRAVLHCALSVVSPCPLCGLPPFRPQVMWNLMRVMWRGRLFAYLWSPCAVGLHLCHFLLAPHLRPTCPYNVHTHPGPPHHVCILTLYSCKWGGETKIQAAPAPTSYSGQAVSRLFQIDVENVSQDACADLATAQTTALAVEVAGTPAYERGSATLDPIDNTVVTGNCADGVTVSFVFGKNG